MTTLRSTLALAALLGLAISASDSFAKPVQPGWDRRVPTARRFKVIYDGFAVLDQETGLVWHRRPSTSPSPWETAVGTCLSSNVGDRRGWRLARADELQSLMDTSQSSPPLTPGHPFVNVNTTFGEMYWTSTDVAGNPSAVYTIGFFGQGQFNIPGKGNATYFAWCVRGPGGAQLD